MYEISLSRLMPNMTPRTRKSCTSGTRNNLFFEWISGIGLENKPMDAGISDRFSTHYCLSPIQLSETTSEFPGLCGSYFTEVGRPNRQECKLIQCRRWVTSWEHS
jgi:hypothetical protein